MKASTRVTVCVVLVSGVSGIRAALSTGTSAACPNITSYRLEVLEEFIEAPAGSLDTADFIAAVYEAFAPEAVLYVPETGSYSGVESIAEYALVVDGKFTNGTFQATSYTINPQEIVVTDDWIQVQYHICASRTRTPSGLQLHVTTTQPECCAYCLQQAKP